MTETMLAEFAKSPVGMSCRELAAWRRNLRALKKLAMPNSQERYITRQRDQIIKLLEEGWLRFCISCGDLLHRDANIRTLYCSTSCQCWAYRARKKRGVKSLGQPVTGLPKRVRTVNQLMQREVLDALCRYRAQAFVAIWQERLPVDAAAWQAWRQTCVYPDDKPLIDICYS